MKKGFTIVIALLYLAVSSGMLVNMHYCMGELAEVSYHTTNNNKCDQCGMENSGCCHNSVKMVKLADNHQPADNVNFQLPVFAAFFTAHPVYNGLFPLLSHSIAFPNTPHPNGNNVSLSILNCVFRI